MEKRVVKFVIPKDGSYRMEAMEGFAGQDCINKTKDIELILGGQQIDEGKKDEYYGGGDNPAEINIFN